MRRGGFVWELCLACCGFAGEIGKMIFVYVWEFASTVFFWVVCCLSGGLCQCLIFSRFFIIKQIQYLVLD